jgi:DDE superfamily endonuclease
VRRTWAPRGATPVLRSWGRQRPRLSALAALTCSPTRCRLGLRWWLGAASVRGADVVAFVRRLRRALGRRLLLVWDRLAVHRYAAWLLDAETSDPRAAYRVAWLPAYAPELDPVESVWAQAKRGVLANYVAPDLDALAGMVDMALGAASIGPALLQGFLRHTALPL